MSIVVVNLFAEAELQGNITTLQHVHLLRVTSGDALGLFWWDPAGKPTDKLMLFVIDKLTRINLVLVYFSKTCSTESPNGVRQSTQFVDSVRGGF